MPYNEKKCANAIKAFASRGAWVAGPRVLIMRDDEEEVSKGGIIIPDEAKRKPLKGTLIAVAPGAQKEADEYGTGPLVLGSRWTFNAYDGIEHTIDTDYGDETPVLVTHVRNLYMNLGKDK